MPGPPLAHYDANTHFVELRGLAINGVEVTSGTVTAEIYDLNAAAVLGSSSIPLAYVGPNGLWRGTMPDSVAVIAGGNYELRVRADSAGTKGYWRPTLKWQERH